MSIPVTVFNPTQEQLMIIVNGGDLVDIPATGPGQNWQPQQPNPNPLSFNTGDPAPNVFGTSAPNQVQIVWGRGPFGPPILIAIPNQSFNSLQLYIFFWPFVVTVWLLQNDGAPIAWNTITGQPVNSDNPD